jgi:hypothetical protein
MGWLGDLLKSGAKPKRSIAEVEKALSRLASKETEAREARDKATRRHDELLLIDGSDKQIAEADAEADRHRLTLERIEKARPLLLAEYEGLCDEATVARWRDHRARRLADATAYRDSLRAANERRDAADATDAAGEAEPYAFLTRSFTLLTRTVSHDTLNELDAGLDRDRDLAIAAQAEADLRARLAQRPGRTASAPPPQAKTAPVTTLPIVVRTAPNIGTPAKLQAAPPPPPKPKRERIVEPIAEGRKRYDVVRHGLEIDGTQYAVGDVIALKPAEAERLQRSGAVDLHQEDAA